MTERSMRLSRRWLFIPLIAAGVVFFAYFLLWRGGAAEMKNAVDEWAQDQRAAGLYVSYGAVTTEGFPFFLRVHIDDPVVADPGAWRWRARRLSIDTLPYDLKARMIFSLDGEQTLRTRDYGEWRLEADDFHADIAYDKARGWAFAMTVAEAAARRRRGGARIALESLVYDLAPDAAEPSTLTLALALAGLVVEAGGDAYTLADFRINLALSQAPQLAPPDPAGQWRTAGGALVVESFYADIENAKLSAAGTVGVDENNRIQGRMRAELRNPAALAAFLDKTGALTPEEAESAAAGLTLMAIAGGGVIAAPIELKDGAASIGGVKIADLPYIDDLSGPDAVEAAKDQP